MKRIFFNNMRFVFLFLFFALPSVICAQTGDDFGANVKKALAAYDQAWARKDAVAVSALLAPNYTYFTSTGGLTDRKRTLEFLASQDYKLTFSERSEIVALHADARLFILSSRWKGRGTFGKEAIDDDQRCGLVFLKSKGNWQIVSEHCVNINK